MEILLSALGMGIAGATLLAILWSIAFPAQRLWPPARYTWWTPILVWVPTFTLFGVLIALGLLGWGELPLPHRLRFGLGISLIVIGNIVVWSAVSGFGIHKTGGAQGGLQIDGLYRFSRNPQYLADIVMIVGWMVLSAAPLVVLVGSVAMVVLVIAPFSEEPWLRSKYGSSFDEYAKKVRRFF